MLTKLSVPKDDFPIPLNCMDVQRLTKSSKMYFERRPIADYWHMDGDRSMSETWIGVTRFALLSKNPPGGYMWVQGRLTNKEVTTRPGII